MSNAVGNENGTTPAATSRGSTAGLKAPSVFKGVLIVSAVVYVTITWALQSVARFN